MTERVFLGFGFAAVAVVAGIGLATDRSAETLAAAGVLSALLTGLVALLFADRQHSETLRHQESESGRARVADVRAEDVKAIRGWMRDVVYGSLEAHAKHAEFSRRVAEANTDDQGVIPAAESATLLQEMESIRTANDRLVTAGVDIGVEGLLAGVTDKDLIDSVLDAKTALIQAQEAYKQMSQLAIDQELEERRREWQAAAMAAEISVDVITQHAAEIARKLERYATGA